MPTSQVSLYLRISSKVGVGNTHPQTWLISTRARTSTRRPSNKARLHTKARSGIRAATTRVRRQRRCHPQPDGQHHPHRCHHYRVRQPLGQNQRQARRRHARQPRHHRDQCDHQYRRDRRGRLDQRGQRQHQRRRQRDQPPRRRGTSRDWRERRPHVTGGVRSAGLTRTPPTHSRRLLLLGGSCLASKSFSRLTTTMATAAA
mmetsp:Transcript_60806/g.166989  ORF Transcript_60806/g.166989 Transcript_60806/m.166989 type:complete len:202 (+) Transcript_60806:949-1554(+)